MHAKITSPYTGLSWCRKSKKFRLTLEHKGRRYLDTYVNDDREGAKMRDISILKNRLNVPLQILKPKADVTG